MGVGIKNGDIVWLQGPFSTGKHNNCTHFKNCLANYLDPYECIEPDNRYKAVDADKVKSKSGFSSGYLLGDIFEAKKRIRARYETVKKESNSLLRFHLFFATI